MKGPGSLRREDPLIGNEEKSKVPAVETALQIIDLLSRYKYKKSTLTEICLKLDIKKSTCLRILRVLKKYQVVSYDEDTKKYGLGTYLVVLGERASEFTDYLDVIKPHLRSLMENTQLTCVLLQPMGNRQLMYVAKAEPEQTIRINVTLGQYFPLTATAFGKCFLAYMSESRLDEVIRETGIRKFTPKTITDSDDLKHNLKQVIEKGYAVSYEEHTPGVVGVAAPIFGVNAEVQLVIACLGVAGYMDEDKVIACGEMARTAAAGITRSLGHR